MLIPRIFRKKSKGRLLSPFYYSSHSIHRQNKMNNLRRKRLSNPAKKNLASLQTATTDFQQSVEHDKICFLAGHNTGSTTDAFNLLKCLHFSDIPLEMYHGSKVLTKDRNIANEFICYFASNFNQQVYNLNPDILYSDTYSAAIRTDELLQDICEANILDTILGTKRSSAVVFDQFPLKLLHLCPRFFSSVPFWAPYCF